MPDSTVMPAKAGIQGTDGAGSRGDNPEKNARE